MKLQLGCFHQGLDGWVNTDITPNLFIARVPFAASLLHRLHIMNDQHYAWQKEGRFKGVRYLNVARRFPYRDHIFDAVFCCHMVEHLEPGQARHMFREVLRILKPGGVFRVVVPDLDWAVSLYDSRNPDHFLDAMYEHGGGSSKNNHKWMYTRDSLKHFFEQQGFLDVQDCVYREGRLPDVERIDSRPENSIFMEGIRPNEPMV
jgi:predicted SAM-dependent methyltransferase